MKYLITNKNVQWDLFYSDVMYFKDDVERDEYVNTYIHEDWKEEIESSTNKATADQLNLDGGQIQVKWKGNIDELWNKNTLITKIKGDYKFWFIKSVTSLGNNSMYEIEVENNVFLSFPGILETTNSLELLEGHVPEYLLLDESIDGGVRTSSDIIPLERDIDLFEEYPNIDPKKLNNQWIYVIIKSPSEEQDLFIYGGEIMPYRILIAPLNDIVLDESADKLILANTSFNYRTLVRDIGNNSFPNAIDPQSSNSDYEKEELYPLSNNRTPGNDMQISYESNGSIRNLTLKDSYVTNKCTDQWCPIILNNQGEMDKLMNNGVTSNTESRGTQLMMLKLDTATNTFRMRYAKVGRDDLSGVNLWFFSGELEDRVLWVGTGLKLNYWHNAEGRVIKGTSAPTDEPKVRYISTDAYEGEGSSYKWTYDNYNINVFSIYEGDPDSSEIVELFTKTSLVNYVNDQMNVSSGGSEIVGAKISSYNPLHIDRSDNSIMNLRTLYYLNGNIIETDNSGTAPEIYELMYIEPELSKEFNTYDMSKYLNKSWIKGIENYSILIENNVEFDISLKDLYSSNGKFTHEVIPLPNEWTERIVFDNVLHNEGLQFKNQKEFIFANNALNDYKVNNPGALENQAFTQGINNLRGISTAALAIGTGGIASVAGPSIIGNLIVDNVNYKSNLKQLRNRPAIATGSGSALEDMILNKNGFGLTLVEWLYTTPKAKATVESLIRYGLSYDQSLILDFDEIKNSEYNYIRINNAMSVIDNSYGYKIKEIFYNTFNSGVRLWYNAENFKNFDVDNGYEYVKRDMIKHI